MTLKRISLAGIALLLGMLACSLPGVAQPTAIVDQTATVTVVTPRDPTSDGSEIAPTATLSATPNRTATPNGSVTATITPTYSVPILTVLEPTNCRTGPGEQYEVILTYVAGKELEIVGRYDAGNFWLVSSPESPGGRCWLFGEFVEVTGSYWAVASVTAPATSTNPPPQQVILENWEFFCTGGTLNITILWFDRAENEAGYRVFLNGEPIAELPANSTTYTGSTEIEAGQWAEYYIQVHGESGSANSSIMRMTCG
ncbi:MAG TPA: SH3 domain-containing protein [Anaerolineales bacterium]|nr:SH3 domain-containing protein [Anaerolineales bacterium]